MLSLRAMFERVVGQGRRAILKVAHSKIDPPSRTNQFKLTEKGPQQRIERLQSRGLISNQHCVSEVQKSTSASCLSLSSGTGIVNLLRPITSRFFQGIARRVSSPLWTEARRKTTRQLFGETAPYFALVGVTLVAGPERGLLTAQDELEAVCEDIRVAISRAGWIHNPNFWKCTPPEKDCKKTTDSEEFSLTNFDIGPAISKGCNAVVYAAKWNEEKENECRTSWDTECCKAFVRPATSLQAVGSLEDILANGSLWSLGQIRSKSVTDQASTSVNDEVTVGETELLNEEEAHASAFTFTLSESQGADSDLDESLSTIKDSVSRSSTVESNLEHFSLSLSGNDLATSKIELPMSSRSSVSSPEEQELPKTSELSKRKGNGPQKRKRVKFMETEKILPAEEQATDPPKPENTSQQNLFHNDSASLKSYPLAIKMLFNYEAESNAPSILRAMYKETLPAKAVQLDQASSAVKERLLNSSSSLPPHPNIVDMPCVFIDRIPSLSDGLSLYPDALPRRINPSGYGRNMSLFCVMQRYDCTLTEYLGRQKPTTRISLLLLTQLLEAINHINKYGVAHRDLKSDNILLHLGEGFESPYLVLSDFGCCLPNSSLLVAFPSYESDPRVGNAALMAPEIKAAAPGIFTKLNYGRADLWACGALAYEIFGLENPFVPAVSTLGGAKKGVAIDSSSYKETQLPKMPKTVPCEVRFLVQDLLRRNPKQRPSPTVAATVCQLSLWGPRKWLNRHSLAMPSNCEVMRWLLCLSTKVLCEAGGSTSHSTRKGATEKLERQAGGALEYEIVSTFLKRVHYSDIVEAIRWIRAF